MKRSAGLVLIKNKKILLCHPTNSSWKGTFSIPKGGIENNESKIEAAIRETYEEVGIIIPEKFINSNEKEIVYLDGKGKVYKRVFYYVVDISESELPDILSKEQLQIEEVDYAEFYDYSSAKEKIFWRFDPILDLIK